MIKTVFFDIGNVLIYFSYEKMCEQIGHVCGMTSNEVDIQLRQNNFGERHETGEISSDELYQHFTNHSLQDFSIDDFVHAATTIFDPNYSLWPTVRSLKEKGIRLLLLSNTCDIHFQYIEKNYRIIEEFEYKTLSHIVKARKPDRRIFISALEMCGCDPEECFYVDDIPEYVEAARELGIDAEVFTHTDQFLNDLKRRQLSNSL